MVYICKAKKNEKVTLYAVTGCNSTEAVKAVLKKNKTSYSKAGEHGYKPGRLVGNDVWNRKDIDHGEDCIIVYKKKSKKEIFG